MTPIGRRTVVGGLALAMAGPAAGAAAREGSLHGLIGKMKAKPGQRAALLAILGRDTGAMPGCLAYIIAEDAGDPDGIWISEVWDGKASHDASLQLPAVRAAIAAGRPLIAGFETSVETRPIAGAGLIPG